MELDELITIWQAGDAKMNNAVKLNSGTLDLILSQKVKSALKSVWWQRVIELSCHFIALILLFAFLLYNIQQMRYAVSAIVLIVFYSFLFINCLKQIQIIMGSANMESLVSKQKSLMKIQTHLLTFTRLSVLCIPAFLSYPVVVSKAFDDLDITIFGDFDLLKITNGTWWYAELIAYIVLIPLGLWFYNQVNIKNIHKAWVARIIKTSSSRRVAKAINYLSELNEFKTELPGKD
jgi:hypothetical protein